MEGVRGQGGAIAATQGSPDLQESTVKLNSPVFIIGANKIAFIIGVNKIAPKFVTLVATYIYHSAF